MAAPINAFRRSKLVNNFNKKLKTIFGMRRFYLIKRDKL